MSEKVFEQVAATLVERIGNRIAADLRDRQMQHEVYYSQLGVLLLSSDPNTVDDKMYNAMAYDNFHNEVWLPPRTSRGEC